MAGEDVYSWSTTATANGSADTLINWSEGQPRNSVNNSARSMMAALAKQFALFTGAVVTAGTANAQTFTSGVGYTVIPNNFYCRLKIGVGLTNTGAATLRMDGLGVIAVLKASGTALSGGELPANGYVELVYNGANWILLTTTASVGGGGGGGPPSSITLAQTAGSFFYHPAVTMTSVLVECIGGGGGGGGVDGIFYSGTGPVNGWFVSSGGGGSGGYSRKLLTASDVGTSMPITIGASGASGVAQNGQPGGVTQFGSGGGLCKALGGLGGVFGGPGGAGGAIGVGDIVCSGAAGEAGFAASQTADMLSGVAAMSRSGAGGSGIYGGGGAVPFSGASGPQAGQAGRFGGGGSGATNQYNGGSSSGGAAGGNGGAGVIVITEYGGAGVVNTVP